MSVIRRRRIRLADASGMTLIELMIAAMIAAVGVGAVTTVLVGSRDLVTHSERGDAIAHVAQREMESALAVPYEELALDQAPTTSSDSRDPRYYVSASGSGWYYRWDQRPGGAAATRVLISPTGGLKPVSAWQEGRHRGTVYRFVTVYDDPTVSNDPMDPVLLGEGDGKRVTVAVTVDGGQRARKAVVSNSVVLP